MCLREWMSLVRVSFISDDEFSLPLHSAQPLARLRSVADRQHEEEEEEEEEKGGAGEETFPNCAVTKIFNALNSQSLPVR